MVQIITGRLSTIHELLSSTFSEKSAQSNISFEFKPDERSVANKVYALTSSITLVSSNEIVKSPVTTNLKMLPISEVQTILNLRRMYNNIYECTKAINFIFGLHILIYVSHTMTGLTACLYSIVRVFNEPIEAVTNIHISEFIISRVTWTTLLLGTMIAMTLICQKATSETQDIRHEVQTLLLENPLSNDVLQQLQLFSQQISSDRIEFTAAGFFIINLLYCAVL
jgi:hypothetical protein